MHSKLNAFGQEELDQTPITINVGRRKLSKFDDVRNFIRAELSAAAQNSGAETFEEANDFDIPDDPPITSRWEYSADQEAEDLEDIKRGAEALKRQRIAARQARTTQDQTPASNGTATSGTPAGATPAASSRPVDPT